MASAATATSASACAASGLPAPGGAVVSLCASDRHARVRVRARARAPTLVPCRPPPSRLQGSGASIASYYRSRLDSLELQTAERTATLRRLEAQRAALNAKVRALREELALLHEPGSNIGEVAKIMAGPGAGGDLSKVRVLVKTSSDGKYIVDVDPAIDLALLVPNARVALRSDSYTLHRVLPTKVDPLVSLMKVEKVPDATYDMVGGLDKQISACAGRAPLPARCARGARAPSPPPSPPSSSAIPARASGDKGGD